MEKILFIHTHLLDGKSGGAQRTLQALNGLKLQYKVVEYSCYKKANKIKGLFRNLQLFSGMMTLRDSKRILKLILNDDFKFVFFDCSLHGKVVKSIKKRKADQKVVVNYHNNESNYYYDMFRLQGVPYYLVYKVAAYNERLSNKFGDLHVFISDEDRKSMSLNGESLVVPVTLKDNYVTQIESSSEKYVLFLGSAFFANIEAAEFLIKNIAPYSKYKIKIVGKGMKSILNRVYDNVEVVDFVPDLSKVMQNALAFISPIFSGSGAKIKIAEALMYGKKIIGTTGSFCGYNKQLMNFVECNDSKEFISAINSLESNICFYKENRDLFINEYSDINNDRYYREISNLL